MNCVEFRRTCLSEGNANSRQAVEHRKSCATCSHFFSEFQGFSSLLKKAIKLEVPDELKARVMLRQSFARPRFNRLYALAASVLILIASGTLFLWQGANDAALREAVLTHYQEPHVVVSPDIQPAAQQLVVENLGGHLEGGLSSVLFANLCVVRGRPAGHFVVAQDGSEVMVLIMPHEILKERQTYVEGSNAIYLIPMGKGSLGVVAPATTPVDRIEHEVRKGISWSI